MMATTGPKVGWAVDRSLDLAVRVPKQEYAGTLEV